MLSIHFICYELEKKPKLTTNSSVKSSEDDLLKLSSLLWRMSILISLILWLYKNQIRTSSFSFSRTYHFSSIFFNFSFFKNLILNITNKSFFFLIFDFGPTNSRLYLKDVSISVLRSISIIVFNKLYSRSTVQDYPYQS